MNTTIRISALIILFTPHLAFGDTPTKVVIFKAYTQGNTLNPELIVAQRYSGTCLARSLSIPYRPDAWRCRASNLILDPCFEDGDSVACVVAPWSHKASILELNQPLYRTPNKSINIQTAQPWGFELENGQRCTYLTGASTAINNVRLNYSCESYNYSILGSVDRTQPVWKVDVYDFNTRKITRMSVVRVWF